MATLSQHEKTILRASDRNLVVEALKRVIESNGGPWLKSGHRAEFGVGRHNKPGAQYPLSPQDLAEYLALAAPNHCMDGWSYLSRALNAYLMGDPHSAWHFAYYAELRAAQSILSAAGCGVFNDWNAVLDGNGLIQRVDPPQSTKIKGTHTMVWLALPEVMQFSNGASALASATEIFGNALPDLVSYAFPGLSPIQTASKWIKDWTFDIQLGIEDKSFRNRCSYSPHIVTPHDANIDDVVTFFEEFWIAIQPTPGANFLDIDKYVLRRALVEQATEKLILNRQNRQTLSKEEIASEVADAYNRIQSSAPTISYVPKEFFTQIDPRELKLLDVAKNKNPSPSNPQPVIARATLLLRMATGVSQKLLIDAGYRNGTEIDFWFSRLAEEHGLVESFQEIVNDRTALYADGAVAVEDMLAAYSDAASPVRRSKIFCDARLNVPSLCAANRVAHWGLQP
jgi:hypothetical protein